MTIASAWMIGCLLPAICLAAGSARAQESVADQLRAAQAAARENSVSRSTTSRYYTAYYVDLCSNAVRESIFTRHCQALKTLLAKDSAAKRPAYHVALGRAYAARGDWAATRRAMEKALALDTHGKLSDESRADALFELANCHWVRGEKEAAWAKIAQIAALPFPANAPRRARHFELARYLWRSQRDVDADLDVFTLPHHTDGAPFPVPQEAAYSSQTLPLDEVRLSLAGLGDDAPAIRLLKRKLSRFGVRFGARGTRVRVAVSAEAPVAQAEGYALDVTAEGVNIAARTAPGALWGVVSFIQSIDRAARTVRYCAIRDWPATRRRGTLTLCELDYLEYALFAKMNSVVIRFDDNWTLSPLEQECYRRFARRFEAFGIETYANMRHLTVRPCVALTASRVRALHLDMARFLASAGLGFAFMLDDHRFPLPDCDLQAAGSAANLDAKYLTRLYRTVKADYPGFKMVFCPPFYWGPDGRARYPEPREAYLASLGVDLDGGIEVYWTGPRVKAASMTPEKTAWYAQLIGRKPGIFHNGNGVGQHNYCDFGADVSAYKRLHGTNLAAHIAFFHMNTTHFGEAGKALSAMDWCWNPVGHEAHTAARRLVAQLEGPGVFEVLARAMPALSYFDKYEYGRVRGELLTESLAELEGKLACAEAAWREAVAKARNGGIFIRGFNAQGITWARRVVDCRREVPPWLEKMHEADMANTGFAQREAGFDSAQGDVFVPAEMMNGGDYVQSFPERKVKYLQPHDAVKTSFPCDQFPPEKPYELILVGRSSSADGGARLEVSLNGRPVAVREMFRPWVFKPEKIALPVEALARHNALCVSNVCDNARTAILHYFVIKR